MSAHPMDHLIGPGAGPLSARARRLTVAAMFSLHTRPGPGRAALKHAARSAAEALDRALVPGSLAFVTGPSGAGKSSILAAFERRTRQHGGAVSVVDPATIRAERRAVIDLFNRPLREDLRLLCTLGLSEAPLWLRPARDLSEGQRWRLALALAARDALASHRPATLIIDEFASTLDRLSAMSLCAGVSRFVRRHPSLRVVAASAHDDLVDWLDADVLLTLEPAFPRTARYTLRARSHP